MAGEPGGGLTTNGGTDDHTDGGPTGQTDDHTDGGPIDGTDDHPHGGEVAAAGRLVGEALAGVVRVVADVHTALTRRLSSLLPRPARAIVELQGAATSAIYTTVEAAHRYLPPVAAGITTAVTKPPERPWPESPAGQVVLSAVNGIWGDHILVRHPTLAVPTALRASLADLALDPAALAAVLPAAPRVVVFLHGLAESDAAWNWGGAPSYAEMLRTHGLTPVQLRYNSGLTHEENGTAVSDLLERLVHSWPVALEELHLVGHSMGGLVARWAGQQGELAGKTWTGMVRTVVTLGTPHLGAPLARAVHVAEDLLTHLPETRPIARILASRSAGVRDLGEGTDVVALPHANHYYVAATMTDRADHLAARLVGDGLVLPLSAFGGHGTAAAVNRLADVVHVGGAHHFSLLNHHEVAALLRIWLAPGTPAPSPEQGEPPVE